MALIIKKNVKPTRVLVGFIVVLLIAVLGYLIQPFFLSSESNAMKTELASLEEKLNTTVSFDQQVKPILDKRCVVCHGCYDAPCQLKLSSVDGMQRGAISENIYDPSRIVTMQPTRLYIDEKSTKQWRTRGFSPILNEKNQGHEKNLKNSVMYHLLRLKQQHPQPEKGLLPTSFTLDIDREQTCPTINSVDEYAKINPLWGMPYAMPNLSDSEYKTLVAWLAQGSAMPTSSKPSDIVFPQIEQWEKFLNQKSNKQQLVSRYLYEHLFHAHIHFENSSNREFYRLVRSNTPPGERVNEIATVLPYDDPKSRVFYYRLLRYQPSIVAKNHIMYEFSETRMQRYRELFIVLDYEVAQLPSYEIDVASNPFKTFAALPLKSRYRFLLDDAHFFIEGFIKGPVCRGQIALDVIEDQFWVLFFDPDQSVITNSEAFIERMADKLQVPADGGNNLNFLSIWTDYWQGQRRYMEKKQEWFKTIGTHDLNHAMNFIWDGDGVNPNAALTVFRHFDSGSVAYGLVGDNPETAWVIDYPLFERIHYLLVAGFNIFGNLGHRMNTRIYMDFLRMEGEDYFLAFLPASHRKKIRDSWYQGQRKSIKKLFSTPEKWLETESVDGYLTDDPQQELYATIKYKILDLKHSTESMNNCGKINCEVSSATKLRIDRAMSKIARIQGKELHAFPDVAFVHIKMDDPEQDLGYTLIRNKAYKNVTSFLADEHDRVRADIEKDSMTVVNWLEGSYPNFFFSVKLSEIEDFIKICSAINNSKDYEKFVDRYGIRRTNPDFWRQADWFQDQYARKKQLISGLFDLNRYQNR